MQESIDLSDPAVGTGISSEDSTPYGGGEVGEDGSDRDCRCFETGSKSGESFTRARLRVSLHISHVRHNRA